MSGLVDLAITPTAGINVTSASWSLPGCSWSQNTADPDGLFRVTGADTAGCTAGEQTMWWSLNWTDTHGRGHSYSDSITVTVTDTTAPTVQVYNPSYYQQQTITRTNPTTLSTIWMPFTCIDGSAVTWDFALTNSRGDTVRTWTPDQAHTSNRCNNYYYDAYLYLDGTDPDGNPPPDGDYTFTATTTDTGGLTGNATATITIDTRTPGTLTTPTEGTTLAGRPRFVFDPASQAAISRVDYNVAGRSFSTYNAGSDGKWRTSYPMGDMPKGQATVSWGVAWRTSNGREYYYSGAPFEVAIDPVAIPLTATADPTSGLAPLKTILRIDASDPQSRDLTARVNWGDGTIETRQMVSPYDQPALDHEFAEPGKYTVFVPVSNGQGGYSSTSIDVSANGRPNDPPTLQTDVTPTTGTAPLTVTANFSAQDPQDDSLTYRIDFGDGSAAQTGSYPAASPITHEYRRMGSYLVRVSISDGKLTASTSTRVQVGLAEPLKALPEMTFPVITGQAVSFDASNSRPSVGIESFAWDFGDGSSTTSTTAEHTYTQPGSYTATLSISAGGKTDKDTREVIVSTPPPTPALEVTVRDRGSQAINGADVVVIDSGGTKFSAVTDAVGRATLPTLPDGEYTAYAWKQGYLPEAATVTVTAGMWGPRRSPFRTARWRRPRWTPAC